MTEIFSSWQRIWVVSVTLMVLAGADSASAGRFVSITETATFSRGEGEVVQATAFSSFTGGPHRENALELQVGVEYGLLHRFQVGFALPNVATVWTQNEKTTKVGGTAMWGLFNLIDPESAGWGLSFAAIYGQGDDDRSGELALLAEKPLGDWIIVYNGVFGRSWARIEEFGETDAMFHGLGASYQVSGSVFLGIEAHWHMENSDGSSWETAGRHLGPNLSVETGPLWITAAAHFAFGPGDNNPEKVFQTQVGLPF
jgi:hypothetical protein